MKEVTPFEHMKQPKASDKTLCKSKCESLKLKKGPGFIPNPFECYLYLTTARIDITTRINVTTAGINYVAATRINYITTGFRDFTIRSVGTF
jgi:hypothetical protein